MWLLAWVRITLCPGSSRFACSNVLISVYVILDYTRTLFLSLTHTRTHTYMCTLTGLAAEDDDMSQSESVADDAADAEAVEADNAQTFASYAQLAPAHDRVCACVCVCCVCMIGLGSTRFAS